MLAFLLGRQCHKKYGQNELKYPKLPQTMSAFLLKTQFHKKYAQNELKRPQTPIHPLMTVVLKKNMTGFNQSAQN